MTMATNNVSLHVDRAETFLVKPSQPTPSDLLPLSSFDNNPDLAILCHTVYVYRANDVSNIGKLDPASLVQEALSKALVYYYPLAGKLKRNKDGKLVVHCTGDGVPYVVAVASCTLESLRHLDGIDVVTAKQFVYEHDENDEDGTTPLMIQVTKFACGGFTIGMGLSHAVCDGFGAGMFFKAMAELASGKTECIIKPVWEREKLMGTASEEHMQTLVGQGLYATSPLLPATDLVHECFNVTSDSIRRLKMDLMKKNGGFDNDSNVSFTTLEVLSAYIWRARFKALELNSDGKTVLSFTVGIRKLLDPPLPDGYYGNAFVPAIVDLMGKDLIEGPLTQVVKLIKNSKKNASNIEYINSWLGILESTNQHRGKIEGSGATMVLTDWRQLGLFEQIDFGWKEAVNVIPLPWKMFGYVDLCIFLPPCSLDQSMKGGLRVLVCLPRVAMIKFKEEMCNL